MSHEQVVVYGKLVRDRIPQIIEADGMLPKTRTLDEAETIAALIAKLGEEADEWPDCRPRR